MVSIIISPADPETYPVLLELNEHAVPHVNSIPLEKLASLHRQSVYLGVARDPAGAVAGFLLALAEDADYESMNYRYFQRSYPRFVYIDRIIVSADHRRSGVGAALYGDLLKRLPADSPLLTCEVNLRPPNPGSMAFHRQMGFEPVGEQDTEGGNKRVCLLAKRLLQGG
jgi:uncharacterized protein